MPYLVEMMFTLLGVAVTAWTLFPPPLVVVLVGVIVVAGGVHSAVTPLVVLACGPVVIQT